ncbi:DUF5947 family protein [Fimbriiglobus ruber]|uniref:Uncharacterized protein n=1 Tax=Fimbriiglobus ruber TaxID=1908690 RepID=A0A225EA65_9BACT|nr:DUF5947 family protein [Fimbriiglobus ruber]OWK45307.1 hypothetical protein FRUB_01638 [Fimbriiglobus ruber]
MSQPTGPMGALRKYARPRPVVERCQLCGRELPPGHRHLLDLASRDLACSCDPCALLFVGQNGAKFRAVPRDGRLLPDFVLTDEQWDHLRTPINLAFFVRRGDGRAVAFYPSPAGATASDLPAGAWDELTAANPVLGDFEPDVEALLVYRVRQTRDYFRAPIDACYELVGLVRSRWRGLTGGSDVWTEIDGFFARAKERWYA